MDNGVVLVAAVLAWVAVAAGVVVILRRQLPTDVLVQIEAVAAAIRETLGDLATEQRVRWMAEYVYDVTLAGGKSRVSREQFADLVWQAVERALQVKELTAEAAGALGMGASYADG